MLKHEIIVYLVQNQVSEFNVTSSIKRRPALKVLNKRDIIEFSKNLVHFVPLSRISAGPADYGRTSGVSRRFTSGIKRIRIS